MLYNGSHTAPCAQTDRQTGMYDTDNAHFAQFLHMCPKQKSNITVMLYTCSAACALYHLSASLSPPFLCADKI